MMKFLLSFMICLSLFSCAPKEKSDVIELQFLEVLTSPARTQVLKDIIARYEALNPNIKITLISPPYEQADNKLAVMLNANETLDIIEVRDHTHKQLVNNEKLLNLESYLENWEEKDDWLDIAWQASRNIDDTAYIFPVSLFLRGLFVRTDILGNLGITEMPKTYEELFAMSAQITDPSKNQYGFAFRGKGGVSFWNTIMLSAVNNLNTAPNKGFWTTDGKTVFEDPNAVMMFQKYIDMFNNAVPPDGINWGFNDQVNGFISGVTPFLIQDPDTVPLVQKQLDAAKFTVVPLPVGETSGKSASYPGYSGFGVTSYTKYPKESVDFLMFLCSVEENIKWNKNYGPLPMFKSAYEGDSYFAKDVYKAWGYMLANPETYIFVQVPLDSPKYPGWLQLEEQYYQSGLIGDITAKEAMDIWAKYWAN